MKSDSAGLKISYELIKLNIKAIIAQNLWNVEGAIEVYNERNAALKRAIEAMNDNTFEKMKIASN